jgi:hypothetical protein
VRVTLRRGSSEGKPRSKTAIMVNPYAYRSFPQTSPEPSPRFLRAVISQCTSAAGTGYTAIAFNYYAETTTRGRGYPRLGQ